MFDRVLTAGFGTRARLAAATTGILLLSAAYYRTHSTSAMTEAAKNFLASLSAEQRAEAVIPFNSDERMDWHYIPKPRKGLPLREMKSEQKALAHALLNTGLSRQGYMKATTIMSLEAVLKVLENGKGPVRDPEGYFFTIFGEPSDTGTWGYRVEGHHLSLNFTLVNGKIASSPSFFGSNPAEVKEGPRAGLRVLGREEDLGRALLESFSAEQKKTAIVDGTAYKDIITAASRKAALEGQPSGLSASRMNAKQRQMLAELVDEYCYDFPDDIAGARLKEAKEAGNRLYFAWAGVEEKGGPHYYRIQAPEFLIEFDDTQNNANHIHSVWRDFGGDFGGDLLKEHYQTSHNLR